MLTFWVFWKNIEGKLIDRFCFSCLTIETVLNFHYTAADKKLNFFNQSFWLFLRLDREINKKFSYPQQLVKSSDTKYHFLLLKQLITLKYDLKGCLLFNRFSPLKTRVLLLELLTRLNGVVVGGVCVMLTWKVNQRKKQLVLIKMYLEDHFRARSYGLWHSSFC